MGRGALSQMTGLEVAQLVLVQVPVLPTVTHTLGVDAVVIGDPDAQFV